MDAATNQVQIDVWYILAGIVVGFAASTLWEWLYFRGRRLAVKERDPYDLIDTDDASPSQAQLVPAQQPPVPSGARLDIEHPGALAVAATTQEAWSPVASSRTPSPAAVAAVASQPSAPPHVARSRGYPARPVGQRGRG